MKGYWTDFYYVGIFPDGSKGYFATEGDYKEEFRSRYPDED